MIYSKQLKQALTELKDCKGLIKVNASDLQRKSVISRRLLGTYKVSIVKKLLNLAGDTGYDLHIVCE
jgi:hypothetical protein